MKHIERTQEVLKWLCALPFDENMNKLERIKRIAYALSISAGLMCGVAGSFAFSFKNSGNLELFTYSLSQVIAFGSAAYSIFVTLFVRKKIKSVFMELTDIYNVFGDEDTLVIFDRTKAKIEWMWDTLFKFIKCMSINLGSLPVLSVIQCIIQHGTLEEKYLYRPGKFELPWNQETLAGYLAEIIFTISVVHCLFVLNGVLVVTFVSICMYHTAFYERFKKLVQRLNTKEADHKRRARDLIVFQNVAKKWFQHTAEMLSPYVLVQLMYTTITIAGIFYYLDKEMKRIDLNVFTLILGLLNNFLTMFLYCFWGKIATESYEMMGTCLYESNWHELPLEIQKHFILMLSNTQRSIYYRGFQLITLKLETFCKLFKSCFTYYMMLKTLQRK